MPMSLPLFEERNGRPLFWAVNPRDTPPGTQLVTICTEWENQGAMKKLVRWLTSGGRDDAEPAHQNCYR
jgi:hypothetical protein